MTALRWLGEGELTLCLAVHRATSRSPGTVRAMRLASRLGDGPLWVLHAALLAAWVGPLAGARLLVALLAATALYQLTKRGTRRLRPGEACPSLRPLAAPLDRYSFPSGHTLHAAVTAGVAGSEAPASLLWLGPLVAAIAASRVTLGLHYPSDVAAGAALGCGIAALALSV
jgi:undecaprenyl-diphosphatase